MTRANRDSQRPWGRAAILASWRACAVIMAIAASFAANALADDPPADYPRQVLADHPTGYWRFEESAEASANIARDASARGSHPGTYRGPVQSTEGVSGIGGRAARFDAARQTLIEVPDGPDLASDAVSVELWLRTTQAFDALFWPGSATLVSKATPGAGSSDWTVHGAASQAGVNAGQVLFETGPRGRLDQFLFSATAPRVNDGRWHHLVATRSAAGEKRLYVDGQLVATAGDGGATVVNTRPIHIGGDLVHEGARFLTGDLDEVAIYPRVLSPQRVLAHYLSAMLPAEVLAAQRRLGERQVDFARDIQPILASRCHECHGAELEEGGLALTNRARALEGGDGGPVLRPKDGYGSRLIAFVTASGSRRMPPDEPPLTADQIALLKQWIDQGADWPPATDVPDRRARATTEHWSFRPLRAVTVPEVRHSHWPRSPIDHFLLARWESRGVAPGPQADRATLLRRASFDLLGLPPTPDLIEWFVGDSSSQERPSAPEDSMRPPFEQLVDRLLASPRYGERWGRHWLDVVRYADSAGYEIDNDYDLAWVYRDYVIRALNEDKPLARFIEEQIAGDELWPDSAEARIATGFATVGPYAFEGGIGRPEVVEYQRLTDLVDTTGEALLGLTLGCARCHAHKYDPLTQRDYFGLQSVFASSGAVDWELPASTAAKFQSPKARVLQNKAAVSTQLLRRGELDQPVNVAEASLPRAFSGGGMLPEEVGASSAGRRSALARWLTGPAHPLTARVIANRIWLWHFGQALVATPNDFGAQGQAPRDDALLDFLARRALSAESALKKLHRDIMTSSAYMLASVPRVPWPSAAADHVNLPGPSVPLARFPRRPLEAEAIWDHLQATAGMLDARMYGPAVYPPIDPAISGAKLNVKWPASKPVSDWNRRGVYVVVRRSLPYPLFETMNGARPTASCARRDTTIVAPQALALLNDPVVAEAARHFAARLLREAGDDPDRIVTLAWRLAFGRTVHADERQAALEFLSKRETALAANPAGIVQPASVPNLPRVTAARASALVELCLALFNTNEFVYVD